VPDVHPGAGAQPSNAVVGSQAARLSKATPPVHAAVHPLIHDWSKVTVPAKLTPPPGHNCALVTTVHNTKQRKINVFFISNKLMYKIIEIEDWICRQQSITKIKNQCSFD
jgi:hypothetical protein